MKIKLVLLLVIVFGKNSFAAERVKNWPIRGEYIPCPALVNVPKIPDHVVVQAVVAAVERVNNKRKASSAPSELLAPLAHSQEGEKWKRLKPAQGSEVKPYPCKEPGCVWSFDNSSNLKRHVRARHEQVRDVACNQCTTTFLFAYELKDHVQAKHMQEKQFACALCDFRGFRKIDLTRHTRKHTGEKPYQCNVCLKSFSESGNAKRHLSQTHKGIEGFITKTL